MVASQEQLWPDVVPEISNPQREIEQFIFLSFYFSQGNSVFQGDLIRHGSVFYESLLPLIDKEAIRTNVAKRAMKWILDGPHSSISKASLDENVFDEVATNVESLYGYNTWDNLPNADDIAMSILESDSEWLLNKTNPGRKGRNISRSGQYHAQYLSHAVFYGLLLRPTNNHAFDAIFQKIHSSMLEMARSRTTEELIELHTSERPQDIPEIETVLSSIEHTPVRYR